MIDRTSTSVCVLVTLGLAVSGCIPFGDPEGPGASGNISLGADASPSGFHTLHVQAIPDSGEPFDPAAPKFAAPSPSEGADLSPLNEDLMSVTFPHAYSIGGDLGTTEVHHFRLFAWLSAATPSEIDPESAALFSASAAPASGEPFGTITFDVDSCGVYGGYCGVTEKVNITIDQMAP